MIEETGNEILKFKVQQGEWVAIQHQTELTFQKALRDGSEIAEKIKPEMCFID